MHAAHHVAVADAAQILDHLLIARFRARLRHAPDRGRVGAAGHDGEAVLRGHVGDLAAEEAQFLSGIADIDMHVGGDFELGLQHFAHGLSAGRPVRCFEQLIGSLMRDLEGAAIGEEIFLLDAERIFGFLRAAAGGANDKMLPLVGEIESQHFQNI